ncbi:hypothetical protein [Paraburkholderia ultramafica]|uniref:hypothetical protein n=1 Tax=Paraburkholderia ultramafica TaxID=1544867 RepID=UPI001582FCE7|nr:hypothetical protein [Paraburkholderia ultramafica]
MSQPDDHETVPRHAEATPKRERGRPRKPDAMTGAQRQAAYRARRKASRESVTVTKNTTPVAAGYDELVSERDRLREELLRARGERDEARLDLLRVRQERNETRQRVAAVRSTEADVREAAPLPDAARLLAAVGPDETGNGDKRLVVNVEYRAIAALNRLRKHFSLPQREVLERLLLRIDHMVIEALGNDEVSFNRYIEWSDS